MKNDILGTVTVDLGECDYHVMRNIRYEQFRSISDDINTNGKKTIIIDEPERNGEAARSMLFLVHLIKLIIWHEGDHPLGLKQDDND